MTRTSARATPERTPELAPTIPPAGAPERTCAACSFFRYVERTDQCGFCGCAEAHEDVDGLDGVRRDFGCLHFLPRDPCAFRAALVDRAMYALYATLWFQAGRTRLPEDYAALRGETRARIEAAAIRVLQAVAVLP